MLNCTFENLIDLEPSQNSPGIQHNASGPSPVSPKGNTAQLPPSQAGSGVSELDNHGFRTDMLGVEVELEQDATSKDSDSEDERESAIRPLHISDKRRAQNSKFSAWCVLSSKG